MARAESNRHRTLATLLVATAVLAGCAYRAYDGKQRRRGDVATVRPQSGVKVTAVDGRRVRGWFIDRVECEPGSRLLIVTVEWSNGHRQIVALPATLVAGFTYEVRHQERPWPPPPPPTTKPKPGAWEVVDRGVMIVAAAAVMTAAVVVAVYAWPLVLPFVLIEVSSTERPDHPPEGRAMQVWIVATSGTDAGRNERGGPREARRIAEWNSVDSLPLPSGGP